MRTSEARSQKILDAVASATPEASVGRADFASSASANLEELEQAVFEWSRVIANLAAGDGAVVLDKRFGLVGFGAEVSAELPSPSRVWRALDTEGRDRLLGTAEPPLEVAQRASRLTSNAR